MKYLGNAFSLNMIAGSHDFRKRVLTEPEFVIGAADAKSVWGHEQSAPIVSSMIGRTVELNRISLTLQPGDELYVAQYQGPRLPEGATALPEGAKFEWVVVTVLN